MAILVVILLGGAMAVAIGLIFLIVVAISSSGRAGSGDRALAVLRERYARGELTSEQYEEMRRELES